MKMNKWRNSASLLIAFRSNVLSSSTKINSQSDNDYKILVMRRHGKNSFMPSRIVFPGGILSESDYSETWKASFKNIFGKQLDDVVTELNLPTSKYPMINENTHWPVHPDIALRICAIRETFEESGFLIAINKRQYDLFKNTKTNDILNNSKYLDSSLIEWRNKILNDPFEFTAMCNHFEILPNVWALMEWNNWLTPKSHSEGKSPDNKRFDTMFYICCFEGNEFPSVIADPNEVTEACWTSPGQLLGNDKECITIEPNLPPPQEYEITELSRIKSLDSLKSVAFKRNHDNHERKRFIGIYLPCKDGHIIVLPGDHLFPDNPDDISMVKSITQNMTIEEARSDTKAKNRFVYEGGRIQGRIFIQDLKDNFKEN